MALVFEAWESDNEANDRWNRSMADPRVGMSVAGGTGQV